jgi:putative transposase
VGRIARRVHQAGVYFVTTDTWEKHPLFINTTLANIVIEQMVSCRDRGFYKLHAFVLMPDHLHVLLTPGETTSVEKAVQMIKGGSAFRIGKEKPQKFPIWHSGFHDRWMSDEQEYRGSRRYIEQNPVEAKLAATPEEYEYSSAMGKYVLDLSQFDQVRG